MGCSDLPVDISYNNGMSGHIVFHYDLISSVLSGGPRDLGVVPEQDAPVIGRFYQGRLVELIFPSTGGRLATDDFPGYSINEAAQIALIYVPILSFLTFAIMAWRHKLRRGPRRRAPLAERPTVASAPSVPAATAAIAWPTEGSPSEEWAAELQMIVDAQDDCAVVRLNGDVDAHTAPRLRQALLELVAEGRNKIIVDLTGVDFMDSSGRAALLPAFKEVQATSGKFIVTGARPNVQMFIDRAGLTRLFDMQPETPDTP